MKLRLIMMFLAGVLLLSPKPVFSQDNSVCLGCHDDPDITAERNGKTVSLSVSGSKFSKFAHKSLKCVQCHEGFNPDDIPHKAKITPISCMKCHKQPASIHPFHPNMANATGTNGSNDINCKGCHGYHYAEVVSDPNAKFNPRNLVNACGECHGKEKADFMGSGHFNAVLQPNKQVMNCFVCHKSPITPGYKLGTAQLKSNQIKLCLNCHVKGDSTGRTAYSSLMIDLGRSNHGSAILRGVKEAPVCFDCHGVHNIKNENQPTSSINRLNIMNICSKCHLNISAQFQSSVHGLALSKKNADAPACAYCHSEHGFRNPVSLPPSMFTANTDLRTRMENNKMIYCISCHTNNDLAARNNIKTVEQAHQWLTAKQKHLETVKCTECHSSNIHSGIAHDILPPDKAVRGCDYCHANSSTLMSVLSRDAKKRSIDKNGFFNGIISSEAYIKGIASNIFIGTFSWIFFVLVLLALGLHAFLRYYFRKPGTRQDNSHQANNKNEGGNI